MCKLTAEQLQDWISSVATGSQLETVLKELIASRPIVDAALQRHAAQDSRDHAAYLRANDLLIEVCDGFQQAQRF